jgi:hypothetical protein
MTGDDPCASIMVTFELGGALVLRIRLGNVARNAVFLNRLGDADVIGQSATEADSGRLRWFP